MLSLLLGKDREEDEYHFYRNLHLLAAQQSKKATSNSNARNPNRGVDGGELLDSLVGELSFWNAVSDEVCAEPDHCTIHNHNQHQYQYQYLQQEQTQQQQQQPGQKRRRSRRTRSAWKSSSGSLSFATRHLHSSNNENKEEHPESTEQQHQSQQDKRHKPVWKAAVDPVTGQTYYYDTVTRHTQWHKPAEVKAMEKKRRAERRARDAIFFKEMEQNIIASLKRGELIPGVPQSSVMATTATQHRRQKSAVVDVGPPREPHSPPPHSQKLQLVTGTLKKAAITATTRSSTPRIRTISGMDEVLLAELRDDKNTAWNARPAPQHSQRQPGHHGPGIATVATLGATTTTTTSNTTTTTTTSKRGRPPLPAGPSKRALEDTEEDYDSDPMELSPDPAHTSKDTHPFHRNTSHSSSSLAAHDSTSDLLAGECLLDEPIQTDDDNMIAELKIGEGTIPAVPPPGQHLRRNTGGTIYLQNTIYNPDIKATIKCVCGVFRAHIAQAAEQPARRSPVSVVKGSNHCSLEDDNDVDEKVFHDNLGKNSIEPSVPSLTEVLAFYEEFYGRSQMEHDTIIMSLIYVERLVKATNGVLSPSPHNWRSVLFACMVLASKVWDDLSMWNIDFSNVSAATAGLSSFTLPRINQLELALLKSLNFDVRVPASEYAKYYFLIRTMLLRSGLVQEFTKPLQRRKQEEAATFSKLESLTEHYQDQTLGKPKLSSSTYGNGNASNTTTSNSTTSRGVTYHKGGSAVPRPEMARFRAQSLDGFLSFIHSSSSPPSTTETPSGPVVLRDTVCLEQLVG